MNEKLFIEFCDLAEPEELANSDANGDVNGDAESASQLSTSPVEEEIPESALEQVCSWHAPP